MDKHPFPCWTVLRCAPQGPLEGPRQVPGRTEPQVPTEGNCLTMHFLLAFIKSFPASLPPSLYFWGPPLK